MTDRKKQNWIWWMIAAVGMTVPLLFAWYTNAAWEDFFITFKFSKNWAEGNGLIYGPGQKIHGFTSPIGTLLPGIAQYIIGGTWLEALWAYRVVCAMALGGAAVLVARGMREFGKWFMLLAVVLLLLDTKAVVYTINGMETAFMLLFVAWMVILLAKDPVRYWWHFGLCWAGLMYTRPDGCIYIAVFALAQLLFTQERRRDILLAFLKAGLFAAALYLPWFIWTWWYYGSPIPNTILAKSARKLAEARHRVPLDFWSWLDMSWQRIIAPYMPIYSKSDDWPAIFGIVAQNLVVIGCFLWLIPMRDRIARALSFSFMCLMAYLIYIPATHPWYLPPVAMLGMLAVTRSIWVMRQRRIVVRVAGLIIALILVVQQAYLALSVPVHPPL